MKKNQRFQIFLTGMLLAFGLHADAQVYQIYNREQNATEALEKRDKSAYTAEMEKGHETNTPKGYTTGQGGLVYYEGFESTTIGDFSFPQGWTTLPTPGLDDDQWLAGALTRDGSRVEGSSGYWYALILGSGANAHDAWAFSPEFQLTANTEYLVRFYVLMDGGSNQSTEHLQVMIGKEASIEAMDTTLWEEEGHAYPAWTEIICQFTPKETGKYNIGLHSLSPSGTGATAVDDLNVVYADEPVFFGTDTIDFGTIGTLDPSTTAIYTFQNKGTSPLSLSVKEMPNSLTIDGLPLTIDPNASGEFKIKFNPNVETGIYSENLILETNHTVDKEVSLTVIASVTPSRLTDYNYEDFETGVIPDEWSCGTDFWLAEGSGLNNSRGIYCMPSYIRRSFRTHHVNMGEKPEVSFWYKGESNATPASTEQVKIRVSLSKDNGVNFTEIYSILPEGGNMQHSPSNAFSKITIPVPDSFANNICIMEVSVDPNGWNNSWTMHLDELSIGTPPNSDLVTLSIQGNHLPTRETTETWQIRVQNRGKQEAKNFEVSLKSSNGDVLTSMQGVSLAPDSIQEFSIPLTISMENEISLYADVSFNGDEYPGNNRTDTVLIRILNSDIDSVSWVENGDYLCRATPIDFQHHQSVTQTIYQANEIGGNTGLIMGLRYSAIAQQGGIQSVPVQIYIGESGKTDFSDEVPIPIDSLTKVFEGAFYFPSGTSFMDIPFNQPYVYQGKNLVVCMVKLSNEFTTSLYFMGSKSDSKRVWSAAIDDFDGSLFPDFPGIGRVSLVEAFPSTVMFIERDINSGIEGTVRADGIPIANAKVSLTGGDLYDTTNQNGEYRIDGLSAGTYTLTAEAFGYKTQTIDDVNVTTGTFTKKDISMEKIPTWTISGKVVSAKDESGIANASVRLLGYANYKASCNTDGTFTIPEVYEGSDYTIEVSAPYYRPSTNILHVDTAITNCKLSLKEQINPIYGLQANAQENSTMKVSWNEPLPQFRYDNNVAISQLGYGNFGEAAVIGSVHRHNTIVHEISWFLTDNGGENPYINLFLFDLDENGNPTKEVIWSTKEVPNKALEWNTFTLPEPVECPHGFLVGASVDYGFLSIGLSEVSEEWPLERGMHYAIENYEYFFEWVDIIDAYPNHVMIRASGEDLGAIDYATYDTILPSVFWNKTEKDSDAGKIKESLVQSYKIYRLEEGQEEADWDLVAENWTDTSFIDMEWTSLGAGISYRYAVVACYADAEADPVLSNTVRHEVANEAESTAQSIRLYPNPFTDEVYLNDASAIRSILIVNMLGQTVTRIDKPVSSVNTESLPSGLYFWLIETQDGELRIFKMVKE